jgi:hypothetical protein
MSSRKPVKWKEIDFEKIKIGLDKKTVKLYYEKTNECGDLITEDLQIQFPHMYLPWGVKENENKSQWSNFKEYYYDCSLRNDSEESNFNSFLENLNKKIKTLISQHSSFKEECNENNYGKIERPGKFKSLIKLNIQRDKEGNFNSYFFKYNSAKKHDKILIKDENIHEILKPGTIFIPTINCSKIYYYKDKYGSVWNMIQMLIINTSENKSSDNNNNNNNNNNNIYTQYSF